MAGATLSNDEEGSVVGGGNESLAHVCAAWKSAAAVGGPLAMPTPGSGGETTEGASFRAECQEAGVERASGDQSLPGRRSLPERRSLLASQRAAERARACERRSTSGDSARVAVASSGKKSSGMSSGRLSVARSSNSSTVMPSDARPMMSASVGSARGVTSEQLASAKTAAGGGLGGVAVAAGTTERDGCLARSLCSSFSCCSRLAAARLAAENCNRASRVAAADEFGCSCSMSGAGAAIVGGALARGPAGGTSCSAL